MSVVPEAVTAPAKAGSSSQSAVSRVLRYSVVRVLALFVTVVIGVYLTIIIANMGGKVDDIQRGNIRQGVAMAVAANPEWAQMDPATRTQMINELVELEEQRLGLDRPFLLRSFVFLRNALTLELGRAQNLTSDSGSRLVRLIILERLPSTLILFASAQIFLFVAAITIALNLSRRYGSFFDKLIIALAPTSAAPAWFYGIFLILVFASVLRVLPFGGMVSVPPPPDTWGYALSLLRHLILPVTAITISSIFLTIYYWRTFFLIYSSEDYVELAKAKGLPSRMIESRYIFRPTLPTILTSFALSLIGMWLGGIVLETVFNWPGLGRLLYLAIGLTDTPVIVGSTVIYAYLLAVTVFVLDILYAIIDPRVKVGTEAPRA